MAIHPDARMHLERGNVECHFKRFNTALEEYNIAIHLQPQYADAYYERGLLFLEKGEYDLAVADLEMVEKLSPSLNVRKPLEEARAKSPKAIAEKKRQAEENEKRRAEADARENMRKSEQLIISGTAHINAKEYDAAIADLHEAILKASYGNLRERANTALAEAIRSDPDCAAAEKRWQEAEQKARQKAEKRRQLKAQIKTPVHIVAGVFLGLLLSFLITCGRGIIGVVGGDIMGIFSTLISIVAAGLGGFLGWVIAQAPE